MKRILIIATLLSTVQAFALDNSGGSYFGQSFEFAAPVVSSTSAVYDKQVGMIIYDLSSGQFKGLNTSGGWDSMTVTGGNQVTSSGTSERVERITVTPTSAGTCSTSNQSGSWITSTTPNATGDCTVTITTGIFSATPVCVATVDETSSPTTDFMGVKISVTSATSFRVRETRISGTSAPSLTVYGAIGGPINVICMGPR
jgi:hypothetical protein